MAPFVSIVPDAIPWERGTETEVAVLFVTTSPVFQAEVRDDGPVDAQWHVVLQAPFGFQFPTENKCAASGEGGEPRRIHPMTCMSSMAKPYNAMIVL